MKVLQILLLFSLAAINSKAANILIMHPIYCGSHEFVLRALGDVLISRGHSVTQVSPSFKKRRKKQFLIIDSSDPLQA